MNRTIRITEPSHVYEKHDINSSILQTLQPNELIKYNREKKRNKLIWMEVQLADGTVGYILRKKTRLFEIANYFICSYVKLDDKIARGFDFKLKDEESIGRSSGVQWYRYFYSEGDLSPIESSIEKITCETSKDNKKNKTMSLTLEYDKNKIDVHPIEFHKNDTFFITYKTVLRNDLLIEVNDLKGKKGFILKQTNTNTLAEERLLKIGVIAAIVGTLWSTYLLIKNGHPSLAAILFLPTIIGAAVASALIPFSFTILVKIFNQIRKHF